jgi:hypothetical protein
MTTKNKTPDCVVTTNDMPNSCVDVPTIKKITVTYEIHPAGTITPKDNQKYGPSTKLNSLPFAVCVDGKVLSMYQNSPDKTKDNSPLIRHEKEPIRINSGQKTSLYLGSDAKAGYRKTPVYEVTAGDNDIVVTIHEKYGIHPNPDTDSKPVFQKTENGKDYYTASLTGDIWLKITHKFTSDEVDTLLASTSLSAPAKQAVSNIYAGHFDPDVNGNAAALTISLTPTYQLKIIWLTESLANIHLNVSQYDAKTDIYTRVHPHTYAALIQAAISTGLTEVHLTSGWRPMLGSVLHRIGLGLDVKVIKNNTESISLHRNRAEYANYAHSTLANEAANDVGNFRDALLKEQDLVRQIFDPWKMDMNTSDQNAPTYNQGISANEKLHENHMHVTAVDAGLGFASSSPATTK